MAFGANYGYNPYINPYASSYSGQQMLQFMPQQTVGCGQQLTQPMQQPQTINNGFVWVNDMNEAANFVVAPNSAVQLWDKNNPCVYLKTADAAGKPTMQIFDLVERKNTTTSTQLPHDSGNDFVQRGEFEALVARVDALVVKEPQGESNRGG